MRVTRRVLASLPAFLLTVAAFGQHYSPVAPIAPTSMAQCNKLQTEWNLYTQEIETEHQNCLDQNGDKRKSQNAAQPPKNEPAISCSVRVCQGLHNRWRSAQSTGPSEVSDCRQKVQKKLDEQTKKIQQDNADRAAKAEEESQRLDNQQRKANADAAAQRQKKLDEQTKKIQKDNAVRAAKAEEESQRLDNQRRKAYGDYMEQHQSWEVRQNYRNQQIKALQDAPMNIEDEAQRHAALESSLKEIARLKAEAKQDPEPKEPQAPKQN